MLGLLHLTLTLTLTLTLNRTRTPNPNPNRDPDQVLGLLHEAGAMADRVLEFYLQDMRAAGLTVCAVVSWVVLGKAAVLVLHENIGAPPLALARPRPPSPPSAPPALPPPQP